MYLCIKFNTTYLNTMKKNVFITTLLALLVTTGHARQNNIVAQTDSSITFVVDGDLPPIKGPFDFTFTGTDVEKHLLSTEQIPEEARHVIATSFSNETNFKYSGYKDSFYRSIVYAYANHMSISLSPDMVWLIISQGFARYVNAHTEELRSKLVTHDGKMDLVIATDNDLLTENTNWPLLIGKFTSQIDKYTKGDIAKTMTSNFSTTGAVERIASQITLMESVKSYFEYIVIYIACGIPNITLQGTPKDWEQVLEKTRALKQYGLGKWVKSLEPILSEFIQAANGYPNQAFWRNMVKKKAIDELRGGGCSSEKPTKLDGWLLKLFPDENGLTSHEVSHTKEMPAEYVRVRFKYQVVSPTDGNVIRNTPMELWAGFIGAQVDTLSNTLTPKMGWLVRLTESDEETLNKLKKEDNDWGIELRIQEVPEILSRLKHINSLNLVFTGKVNLPAWMDDMAIDNFQIEGDMTEKEKATIIQRFPNIKIRSRK